MREFLSARNIPFKERNIRRDPQARAELLALTGELVVPVVAVGDRYLVGYDPEQLESFLFMAERPVTASPPRDSALLEQGPMAVQPVDDLAAMIGDLVLRIREEQAYNAAKGSSPYRQGIHDGLRFAEDALVAILHQCGHGADLPESSDLLRQFDA